MVKAKRTFKTRLVLGAALFDELEYIVFKPAPATLVGVFEKLPMRQLLHVTWMAILYELFKLV